jgi:hypothetical protein
MFDNCFGAAQRAALDRFDVFGHRFDAALVRWRQEVRRQA